MTKSVCYSVYRTRLPKEVHLPDWASLDKQGKKGWSCIILKLSYHSRTH